MDIGCFWVMAIVNSAIRVQLSLRIIIFSGYIPEVGSSNHRSLSCFVRNLSTGLCGACTSLCSKQHCRRLGCVCVCVHVFHPWSPQHLLHAGFLLMAILTAAKQHFVDLWMGTSLIINDLGDLIYCSSLKWCKYNVSAETGILEVHLLYLLIPQPCPGTFLEGRGCLQPYRPGE